MKILSKEVSRPHPTKPTDLSSHRPLSSYSEDELRERIKELTKFRYCSISYVSYLQRVLTRQKMLRLQHQLANQKLAKVSEEDSKLLDGILKPQLVNLDNLSPTLRLLVEAHEKRRKGQHISEWPTLLIRWCLSIYCKSKSTYETLQKDLKLPTTRTLRNYKNAFPNGSGTNTNLIK